MKKAFCALLVFAVAGISVPAYADIQAPPGSQQDSVRKLSRGLANIFYSWTELPSSMIRLNERGEQSTEIIFYGIINGLERTGARIGYGVYEVINFRRPIYKDSFRPPYTSINYDPVNGYEEFPPQIGYYSTLEYTRSRSY